MTKPLVCLAVSALLWMPMCSQGQTPLAELAASRPADQASHDHFIGWYRVPRRNERMQFVEGDPGTFIPVFKRNGTYYSVCRFFEVPLKVIPDGLEWNSKSSSMEGTRITYDARKKEYAITIRDSAAQGLAEEISGLLQPMRKVDKAPFAPADATARPPQSNDDFVGWYEALWMPALRYQIRKEGDRFVAEGQIVGRDDRREPAVELQPLAGSLGFKMGPRGKQQIIYNQQRQRYEVGSDGSDVSMPMKRSDAEPSKDLPKLPDVARVGIPSWH